MEKKDEAKDENIGGVGQIHRRRKTYNADKCLDSIAKNPHLNPPQRDDGDGEVPAKFLVHYSMERRKKQKMLCSQLQVLRLLIEFLQEASTANWEESNLESLSKEVASVRQKWKALKSEYQNKVQEVEKNLPQLLEKIQLLQDKKMQLEECLQRYLSQRAVKEKQAQQELQEVIQKQQQVLQKCQDQIKLLKSEVGRLEQSAESWIQTVNRDSSLVSLLESLQGMSLVSVGEKELVLDISTGHSDVMPLRVNVHVTSEGRFHIEAENSMPDLPPELQCGTTNHMTAVILELACWYQSHGRLLAEMRELQERFAIDWLQEERKLLLLKGSTQYTLCVEPGYPQSGGIRLLSSKGSEQAAVTAHIQPPDERPTLRAWLEYLQSLP
ncbi:outer kinetochore KNL1 complex subunit ZWINT [Gastrophryne carolinensis]